jgi:hypothetical protein
MTIDVDDLASEISAGIYGDDRMGVATLNAAVAALSALVAEVERLRYEAVLLRTGRDATRAYADRVESEVLYLRAERASVVAWLRADAAERDAEGDSDIPRYAAVALRQSANTIERGEHRREEKP